MSPKSPRQARDLSLGLGCVIYEAFVLAAALKLRRDLATRDHPGRVAVGELVLLRCRNLADFLYRPERSRAQIRLRDFTGHPLPRAEFDDLKQFVSVRSAHLSWDRAIDPLPLWQDRGPSIDATGLQLLHHTVAFIEAELNAGRPLKTSRHKRHWHNLQTAHRALTR